MFGHNNIDILRASHAEDVASQIPFSEMGMVSRAGSFLQETPVDGLAQALAAGEVEVALYIYECLLAPEEPKVPQHRSDLQTISGEICAR